MAYIAQLPTKNDLDPGGLSAQVFRLFSAYFGGLVARPTTGQLWPRIKRNG